MHTVGMSFLDTLFEILKFTNKHCAPDSILDIAVACAKCSTIASSTASTASRGGPASPSGMAEVNSPSHLGDADAPFSVMATNDTRSSSVAPRSGRMVACTQIGTSLVPPPPPLSV